MVITGHQPHVRYRFALPLKADITVRNWDVGCGSLADICTATDHVRYVPDSRHQ
jgi:hypothetical protein